MNKSENIVIPDYLDRIAKNHYKSLVRALKKKGIFETVDKGAVEMLASLYSDYRNKDLSSNERRQAIKTYAMLIKEYGGTPASRQSLKINPEQKEEVETNDLEGFFEDEK